MAFIRVKKINGYKYAYLVENVWTNKGPRQKNKKYLGKVYSPRREKSLNFFDFYKDYDIKVRSKKELIIDYIKLELFNHGFVETKRNVWTKDDYIVNIKTLNFINNKNKDFAIELNNGALCPYLIKKIIKLKIEPDKEKEEQEGYMLAKLLVESGLSIDKDIFVRLYELIKAEN